jgi:hypothetical protein
MATLIGLMAFWALITTGFFVLIIYRSRLTKQETDWIPLTDDDREEQAIRAQTVIEMKTRKLTLPIRLLGTLSIVMLFVIAGFWLYQGITTPPAMP